MSTKNASSVRRTPTAFVSYAWESDAHKSWVAEFATRLRSDGVDVTLDQWHLLPGDQLPSFMERAVRDNDFILIICTPCYRARSNDRRGGVGYEGNVMAAEVLTSRNHRKFIPILREGAWDVAAPGWLQGSCHYDFRSPESDRDNYERLVRVLHGQGPTPPPLGVRPDLAMERQASAIAGSPHAEGRRIPFVVVGELPPLCDMLDPLQFQSMCRDLLFDDGVQEVRIYGVSGQAQQGVDIVGWSTEQDHRVVAQCKRKQRFSVAEIKKASDEFMRFWPHWREKNVGRFILFLACEAAKTQQISVIESERERFSSLGIQYQVYDLPAITNLLRTQPEIVRRYFPPQRDWVEYLCGTRPQQPTVRRFDSLSIEQTQWLSFLRTGVEERIAQAIQCWHEGRRGEARRILHDLRGRTAVWESLPAETRASALRFEAQLTLDLSGDVRVARSLADEARTIALSVDDHRLTALLVLHEQGAKAALSLLEKTSAIEEVNLKASLLLRLNRTEEAFVVLKAEAVGALATADTLRLRSIALLASGDIGGAAAEIQRALDAAPKWVAMEFMAAVIDFNKALSRAAVPQGLYHAPVPLPFALIRRDDDALRALEEAERRFASLSAKSDPEDRENQEILESWRLACLGCHANRQEESIRYVNELITNYPTHAFALLWATARNYPLYLEGAAAALRTLVFDGRARPEQAVALTAYYVAKGHVSKASEILARTRETFVESGNLLPWMHWKVQALAVERKFREIDELLSQHDAAGTSITAFSAMRAQARAAEDPDSAKHLLREQLARRPEVDVLWLCCEELSRLECWWDVAERAEDLVNQLGTADAARLAVIALYQTQSYEKCLQMLVDCRSYFPGRRLPHELRSIEAIASFRLGRFSSAERNARDLVSENPSLQNLELLADVLLGRGDTRQLCAIAEQLLNHPDLTSIVSLQLARTVHWDDPELARRLWRQAVKIGIDDEHLTGALSLGSQLRLERDLDPLHRRVAVLAKEGRYGFKVATWDDIVKHAQEFRDEVERVNETYRAAQVPIHWIARRLGFTLAELYHSNLDKTSQSGHILEAPLLLTRHAERPLPDELPQECGDWRLNMDITALLLAAHLEILPEIERAFAPIRIPHSLMVCLVDMRDRLMNIQPSRVVILRSIREGFQRGSIRKLAREDGFETSPQLGWEGLLPELPEAWIRQLRLARAHDALLVDVFPIVMPGHTIARQELPETAQAFLRSPHELVNSLREIGPLSEREHEDALRILGEPDRVPMAPTPPGNRLLCTRGALELLSTLNLLTAAAAKYEIVVSAEVAQEIEQEITTLDERQDLARWLSQLLDQVRVGVEQTKYEVLHGIPREGDQPPDPEELCLREILQNADSREGVAWIDDRCINRHALIGAMPIIDSVDVLRALLGRGELTHERYYRALMRLRAGNVAFIPVTKDEILFHLRKAHVGPAGLVETHDLQVLRRTIAATVLRGAMFRQSVVPGSIGEFDYFVRLFRSVADGIALAVTADHGQPWENRSQGKWLLEQLYIDHFVVREITGLGSKVMPAEFLVAVGLFGLVIRAFSLHDETSSRRSSRSYLSWIYRRFLRTRLRTHPQILVETCALLKSTFLDIVAEEAGDSNDDALRRYVSLTIDDLPELFKREILKDEAFLGALGTPLRSIVTAGPLTFEESAYVSAAILAVNGEEGIARSLNQENDVRFVPRSHAEEECVFWLMPSNGNRVYSRDISLELLARSAAERRKAAERLARRLDLPLTERSKALEELVAIEDPVQRLRRAVELEGRSAVVFYQRLQERIAGRDLQGPEDFFPDDPCLLPRFLRITHEVWDEPPFLSAVEQSAQDLLAGCGLAEALRRLTSLPTAIPELLLAEVRSADLPTQRELIKALLKSASTPVSVIQVLRVIRTCAETDHRWIRRARRLCSWLASDDCVQAFSLYRLCLRWAWDEVVSWPGAKSWAPALRLAVAWSHAAEILRVVLGLHPRNAGRDLVQQLFDSTAFRREHLDAAESSDVSHPLNISLEVMVATGLVYGLDGKEDAVLTDDLRALLFRRLMIEDQAMRYPTPQLLVSAELGTNFINAFLAGDRLSALSRLLPNDSHPYLSTPFAPDLLGEVLNRLEAEPGKTLSWVAMVTALGRMPCPLGHRERISRVIQTTEFGEICRSEPEHGLAAFHAATLRCIDGDEEVRSHLRSQLKVVATFLGSRHGREIPNDQSQQLFDSAFYLLSGLPAEVDWSVAIADILDDIVQACPAAGGMVQDAVWNMCRDLPTADSHRLWGLLEKLRART